MARVRVILSNNRSRVVGSLRVVTKLHSSMKIKSPGYFFSTAWRERKWDGYIRYMTENGTFATGLVYKVIDLLKKWKVKYTIVDNRDNFRPLRKLQGLGKLKGRVYQLMAVKGFMSNKLEGIPFRRGILNEATNAGKILIAALIFANFSSKRKGIFLIDSKTIFGQALEELSELLPGEVGSVQSGKIDLTKRITVCMVQTLVNKLRDPKVARWLAGQSIVVVDECDVVASRKDCKKITNYCMEAPVRLGLSGTPLRSKDKTRNEAILAFFGPVLHTTTNKQLVDAGHSSKPTIRFTKGNISIRHKGDYSYEYERGIIKNKGRNKRVWARVKKKVKKGPVCVLIKYHRHIEYLQKNLPKELKKYRIEYITSKVKNRFNIIDDFNKDKVDILVSSMIIRRGMNMKLMRSLVNAAGGDSESNVIQLFGRGLRKEEGVKEEIDIEEFFDQGFYLQRHSNHRIRYYKQEGFPVQELYK